MERENLSVIEAKGNVSEIIESNEANSSLEQAESSKSSSQDISGASYTENSYEDENSDEEEELQMERIRSFFENRLNFFGSSKEPKEKILNEASLEGVIEYIQKNNIKKIITMAGAGISTSAGIPDFRSPKSGLYNNLEKYKLPHPQAIFEVDFFKKNPEPFFVLAKELLPEGFKPTPCHYFIKLLNDKGLLLRHYTQNIDTLERLAGLPENKLVEAHGTFHSGRCLSCRCPYDLDWMKKKIIDGTIPQCENCDEEGVVKPDIVFFGEQLPDRFHILIDKDFPQAELLIIMGSSLVVQPFASLIERVPSSCPRLLINKEKVGHQNPISKILGFSQGLQFESETNRDVAWLGDCDDGAHLLADKLGWGDELKNLVETEHERLKKMEAEKK